MRLFGWSSKLEKCSAVGCCNGTKICELCRNCGKEEQSHPVAEYRPTQKGRVKMCPRHSSGANRRPFDAQGGTRVQRARLDFAVPEASRLESARFRRGAGRLRSVDPFPWVSHPLMGDSAKRPLYSPCTHRPTIPGASAASSHAFPLVM